VIPPDLTQSARLCAELASLQKDSRDCGENQSEREEELLPAKLALVPHRGWYPAAT